MKHRGWSRTLLTIILISTMLSVIPSFTQPTVRAVATYYIATAADGGNDANPGTHAQPFLTVQHAFNTCGNGDTIYIRAGTYATNRAALTGINSLTIAKDTGHTGTVILDGTTVTGVYEHAIMEFTSCDNLHITGISLYYSGCGGIVLKSGCDIVTIDNCTIFYSDSFAVRSSGDVGPQTYLTIKDCIIEDNHNDWNNFVSQEVISLSGATHFSIHDNYFYKNRYINIDTKSGGGPGEIYNNIFNLTSPSYIIDHTMHNGPAWYIDVHSGAAICNNISFHNNLVWGNTSGLIFATETAGSHYENISVYNNIINITNTNSGTTEHGHYGILLTTNGGTITMAKDIKIYCNTLYNNLHTDNPIRIRSFYTTTNTKRINISNNIITSNLASSTALVTAEGFLYTNTAYVKLNNNLFHCFEAAHTTEYITWSSGTYSTAAYFQNSPSFNDPLFVSTGTDFRILITSPAIDTATSSLVPSTDIYGTLRPQGAGYDRGADEYIAGTAPTVTTNTTTLIGSESITANGCILNKGSTTITQYGFQYGLTTSFGSNIKWIADHLGPFSGIISLLPGTRYYIRAFAWNNLGSLGVGSTETAITQPYSPSGLTGTSTSSTSNLLAWIKGTGTNYTRIQRKTTGYPSSIADGTNIYNNTGLSYNNTGCTPGQLYYYRTWSMTLWGAESKWNSTAYSSYYILTRPDAPTNLIGKNCTNLTHAFVNWTNGTGKDRSIVVKKIGSAPTSPSDGTIMYNGTGNHTIAALTDAAYNYFSVWSYANESSPSTRAWSHTAATVYVTRGAASGCTFSLGPGVYYQTGFTNYSDSHLMCFRNLTIIATTMQFNDTIFNTTVTPTATHVNVTLNYLNTDTTETIPSSLVMNFSAYSPTSTAAVTFSIGGLHPSSSYTILRDTISNGTINSSASGWISFINRSGAWDGATHNYTIYFLLGGTYGGLYVNVYNETDKLPLIFNCTIVNHTGTETVVYRNQTGPIAIAMSSLPKGAEVAIIIDARNHEMRTYYLDVYPGITYTLEAYLPYTLTPLLPSNITYLYYFTVIDEQGYTISDVRYQCYGLVNYTAYHLMQDGYTDGNGKFDVWLLPGKLYKFTLSKVGYQNDTFDLITGTTDYTHTFKLLYHIQNVTPTYNFKDEIHVTGSMDNTTGLLTVTYVDYLIMTIDCQFYIYEINSSTNTNTLFYTYTTIGNSNFTISLPANNSNSYEVVYKMNHTYFGYNTGTFLIRGWHAPTTTPARFNALFVANFGFNPFGWSNVVTWFIIVGCFFSFNRRDSYMAMFLAGFMLLIINYYIGFNTVMSIGTGAAIPIMMIFFGILMLIRDRYRFGVDI